MLTFKSSLVAMLIASLSLFSGCSDDDALVTTTPLVEYTPPPAKKAVSIAIITQESNGTLIDGVTLKYTGNAQDVEGDVITSNTAFNGIASVFSETGTNNIIRVLASKDGYLPTGVEINASAEGDYFKTITLLNLAKAASEGVEVKSTTTTTDATGKTVAERELVTTAGSAVKIPASTTLLKADGTPAVGELKVSVTSFDVNNTEYFPGGFSNVVVSNVPTADGGTTDAAVSFVVSGFTNIRITDANGDPVKSGNFEVTIKLSNTYNAATGAEFQVGEQIPVWSYDEDVTGSWKYEGMGSVEKDANGNFIVKYSVNHLSLISAAQPNNVVSKLNITPTLITVASNVASNQCSTLRVNIDGGVGKPTKVTLYPAGSAKLIAEDTKGEGYVEFKNVTKTYFPTVLDIEPNYHYDDNYIWGANLTHLIIKDCADQTVNPNLPPVPTTPPVTKTIKIVESCADGSNEVPLPNVLIYSFDDGLGVSFSTTNANGEIVIKNSKVNPILSHSAKANRYKLQNPVGGLTNEIRFASYSTSLHSFFSGEFSIPEADSGELRFILQDNNAACQKPLTGATGGTN